MNVLVVDDDEVTRKLLREVLEKEKFQVSMAASGEEAVRRLKSEVFPIVVSDIRMLELDGMAVLREAKKKESRTAVILMTGFGSMEGAIEAIQQGAFDYVSKPFKISDLRAVVHRAAKHWESLSARPVQASASGQTGSRAVIGKSPRILEVYKTIARASMSGSNVLILGESGTGKELIARAIHENSTRRAKKFVAISCGASNEAQLEGDLFGRSPGEAGGLADANGGTLFLDEICDIPSALQARLFKALGRSDGGHEEIRVIGASQKDPEVLVRASRFREDLYYRLKVIEMEIPPLRERMEDLPELVERFLARYSEKNRKPVSHVSDEAMNLLEKYSWPGNIRELENVVERAVAMTGTTVLFPEDFPDEIREGQGVPGAIRTSTGTTDEAATTSLEEMEKVHILRVLQETHYNKSRASEILGIDRATLYRKASRYGIDLTRKPEGSG